MLLFQFEKGDTLREECELEHLVSFTKIQENFSKGESHREGS